MQSVQKKSGFKCPSFAVPAKSTTNSSKSIEKKKEKKEDQEAPSAKPSDGSNEIQAKLPDPSGDNLVNTGKVEKQPQSVNPAGEMAASATHTSNDTAECVQMNNKVKEKEPKKSKFGVKTKPIKEKSTEKAEKKDQTKVKEASTLPVRSLTDEEYDEIFASTIQAALDINMDDWVPRVTIPRVVKEKPKKKYCVTVGKSVAKEQASVIEVNQNDDTSPAEKRDNNVKPKVEEDTVQDHIVDDSGKDEAVEDNVREEGEPQLEVPQANQDEERQDSVQQENETTPVGSEVDPDDQPPQHCDSPPKKKKKKLHHSNNKSEHLEPKQLSFPTGKPQATPIGEKIKKLKKMQKGHQAGNRRHKKQSKMLEKNESSTGKKAATKVQESTKPKKRVNKKKLMLQRELYNDGTWVQCEDCKKWRHLLDVTDPSQLPETWTCSLNTDSAHNSCEKDEEKYDETDHIYTQFTEGSVVWAKMAGYPWWPAMIEVDPDSLIYFDVEEENAMLPTHYHVVFFDDHVSRCWVKTDSLKKFTGSEDEEDVTHRMLSAYKKNVSAAKKNALRALKCNLQERIELFGFAARYKGSWGKIETESSPKIKLPTKKQCKSPDEDLLNNISINDVLDNTDVLLENVDKMLDSLDSQVDSPETDSETSMKDVNSDSLGRKRSTTRAIISDDEDFLDEEHTSVRGNKLDLRDDYVNEKHASSEKMFPDFNTKPVRKENALVKSKKAKHSSNFKDENKSKIASKNEKVASIFKQAELASNSKGYNDLEKESPEEKHAIVDKQDDLVQEVAKDSCEIQSDSEMPKFEENEEQNDRDTVNTLQQNITIKGFVSNSNQNNKTKGDNDEENRSDIDDKNKIEKELSEFEIDDMNKTEAVDKEEDVSADSEESLVPDTGVETADRARPGSSLDVTSDGRQGEQSLGEVEDFDLVEQSMYGSVSGDGLGEKLQEMEFITVPTNQVNFADEDSDPFDLMEE